MPKDNPAANAIADSTGRCLFSDDVICIPQVGVESARNMGI